MPQLRLPHAMIADVEEDTEHGRRTVVLNVNEEYLYDMLDSINPKNIIKYLDMRGIQHRAPTEITFFGKEQSTSHRNGRKYKRLEAEQQRLRNMISDISNGKQQETTENKDQQGSHHRCPRIRLSMAQR